jgi:hypothetical protein
MFSLAGGDSDGLCAAVGKRCGYENRSKASYSANERGTWEAPVLTTNVMMFCIAASVDGDAEDDEYYDGDDFEQAQPVL